MTLAQIILPQLLCLQTVSDALFLSEPVICAGPERVTEVATNVVINILQVCTT